MGSLGGIVGRELEQRQLLQLLSTARGERAAAIALEGEAGIGKTTLLDWLCRQADGFTVLRVCGHEADTASGYLVLRQLLRPILHHIDALDLHLADALQSALRMSDAPVMESLVPLAVLELCSIASTEAPLLLALDDAHLFDTASLAALTFVARRMIVERMLVVFTFRPHELPDPTLFTSMECFALTGLDDAASAAVVAAVGHHLTATAQDWCRGNPLALQHIASLANGPQVGLLPERLRRGFEGRLDRLPTRTRRALALVAVAGSAPSEVLTAALAACAVGAADVQVAIDSEVLGPDGKFHHPLLREAALPPPQLAAEIHDALAGAYGAQVGRGPANRERELLHGLQGAGPFPAEMIAAAEETATQLADDGHTDDAHALFLAAARQAPDPATRTRLLRGAAAVLAYAERYTASLPFFEAALAAAPTIALRLHVMRTLVWVQMWSGVTVGEVATRLFGELRAASADVGQVVDEKELALAWGSLVALYAASDIHAALAALDEMPAGLDLETDEMMVRCLAADPSAVAMRERFRQFVATLPSLEPSATDPAGATHGDLLLLEGHWTAADQWARRFYDEVQQRHNDSEFGPAMSRRIAGRLFLGDCLTAHGLALTTLERSGDDASALGLGALAAAVVGAGVATDWAQRCLDKGRRLGLTTLVVDGLHALGLVALAAGDVQAAVVPLAEAWQLLGDHGFRHPGYAYARGDIAEALALAGRPADARSVITELEAGPFELDWAKGVAARVRGMCGEEGQFERALTLLAESPWEIARTRLAWARAHPSGSSTRHEQATQAVDAFDAMGARPWATLARALLGGGTEVAPSPDDPLAKLSDRERTVAFAVARGLSNKEVAGELFISMKTVDGHLQQIYRKLDVRSRSRLAALCHGSGRAV